MKKLAPVVALLALLTVTVAPATARGAWVDRIEDVDTVLAVRFDDDFPLASLMRATCDYAQFVMQPTGAGVETLRCRLSDEPVMIAAFQGEPPSTAFTFRAGPCTWGSDYWFARDGSEVYAASVHYVVTPNGDVYVTARYAAEPATCE
jgi:hypothetical protein